MTKTKVAALCAGLFLMSGCTLFQAKEPPAPPVQPKKIAVPVGKHWQVTEEPPALTNERTEQSLPFQKPQSVEPPGAPPVAPSTDKRKIETPQ
ncbi:hypothetical protein GMSM_09390 [Geomonas sp. Red276]